MIYQPGDRVRIKSILGYSFAGKFGIVDNIRVTNNPNRFVVWVTVDLPDIISFPLYEEELEKV